MNTPRTPRSRRGWRVALVAIAGLAVLSSCAPPPEQPEVQESHRTQDWRRGDRWRHLRRVAPPTTVVTPSRPAPTTTAPSAPRPATPPAPAPPIVGSRAPLGPSGTWNLKFADEFDGSSLDLNKWRPNWLAGSDSARTPPVNAAELSCYDPAQVRVSGGSLHLTAERVTSSRPGCNLRNGSSASYASGLIQSDDHYNFTHGYVEARMFLPGSADRPENWPAFWTNGQSWPRDGEIDVMEVLGGEPRWHYHATGIDQGSGFDLITPKAGWHTFGALWEPGRITFYYDGREVGSTTRGVVSTSHYIILNHALSSSISGPIVTPSTLQVDYVRHWQR